MAKNYSDYDYKSDANAVLNAKIGWNNATTDEERQKQNQIANEARQRLKNYGYEDLADQISANGANATQTRQIIENYSKPKTTSPVETNNLKSTEVNRENAGVFNKYNNFWDESVNVDPFETSYGKAIMGKYDLSALQGRDNAVASGGASNGGNIDSYAAANAMRQQASLISQGQSAVLDAYQKRIDSARGYLSDMGVNIDRVFNQDETSKNNEVARLSEQASVTGYTPSEWVIKNDAVYSEFLNPDGSFKKEKEGTDIQALINSTTDAETKKKLAVVRAKKILGNYGEFGQYSNTGDISFMTPQETEARRQFDKQDATTREALTTESGLKKYEIDETNKNTLDQITANTEAQKNLMTHQSNLTGGTTKLSDETYKSAKDVIALINANAKKVYDGTNNKYNLDRDIIAPGGNNTFVLTLPSDNSNKNGWKEVIIHPLLDAVERGSLKEEEMGQIVSQLGLTEYFLDAQQSWKNQQ